MTFANKIAPIALALSALTGSASALDAIHAKPAIVLSAEEIAQLGIETAPALRTTFTPQVRGYGVVSNLSTVAQTDSDIRTGQAAVTDSQAALVRATHLFRENAMSEQALFTARHQAASDRAQLELADRKEIATFGAHAPWRGATRDAAILAALTAGTSQIVEATFPLGIVFDGPPATLVITRLDTQDGQKSWTSRLNWDAPADPTIPGRSFYSLVDHSELAQGEHVLVFAPVGAPIDGVRVPSDAVILSEDKPWCYVVVSDHHFRRIQIDLRQQVSGGYFVASGIAPNQRVVVKGTGLLLARELGAATPDQD